MSNSFNHSKFRFFDKSGTELMIKRTNGITIELLNSKHESCNSAYALVMGGGSATIDEAVLIKTKTGSRFPAMSEDPSVTEYTVRAKVTNPDGEAHVTDISLPYSMFDWIEYSSSNAYVRPDSSAQVKLEGYPELLKFNSLPSEKKEEFIRLFGIHTEMPEVPTSTFEGTLTFDKVSTDLVETQSIYVLVETDDPYDSITGAHGLVDASTYGKTNEYAASYINKYDMFFFIDCRDQEDFRFFTVDGDEIVWSDRHTIDFSRGRIGTSDNGIRVDIGFKGELEGVYEEKMYVCLMDRHTKNIDILGTFTLTAETEGEDERYRAFFANFGLPPMDETEAVFSGTDLNEENPDYISMNRHAKEIYLTYSEIFPYVGTYRALFHAVRMLGYEDIFFKEWYKDLGKETPNDDGYIAFDISFNDSGSTNTITSRSIEERIQLKKMNWISMMYHLNEESDAQEDKWGFLSTEEKTNYYTTDNLVKLIALRKWLEKYIIGLNCHITDIGGEGIVFERYSLPKFGQYQQVLDYTSEYPVSISLPYRNTDHFTGGTSVGVRIDSGTHDNEIEDYENVRFSDLCEGYFDNESTYHVKKTEELIDSSLYIYYGPTFTTQHVRDICDVRAKGRHRSFILDSSTYIKEGTPRILIDDERMTFVPLDSKTYGRNTMFKMLPTIKVSRGRIKRYVKNHETDGTLAYEAEIKPAGATGTETTAHAISYEYGNIEYNYDCPEAFTFMPPKHSETDSSIVIYPAYSDSSVWMPKFNQYQIHGETSDSSIANANLTYGLRITSDTTTGEMAMLITGYECPEIFEHCAKYFPPIDEGSDDPKEYYLEILDGALIFDDYLTRTETFVIFSYDSVTHRKKIEVKTRKTKRFETAYSYSDTTAITKFTDGNTYAEFTRKYREGADIAIEINNVCDIEISHNGMYNFDAFVFDMQNGTYYVKTDTEFSVTNEHIDASIFSESANAKASASDPNPTRADSSTMRKLRNEATPDADVCLYEYVPKLPICTREGADIEIASGQYQDHTADSTPEEIRNNIHPRYAQFTNTSTRFTYNGSYEYMDSSTMDSSINVYSFIRKSYRASDYGPIGVDTFRDLYRIAKLHGIETLPDTGETLSHRFNEILMQCNAKAIDSSLMVGSFAGVMITLYDESCEYPLYTYPAVCLPTREFRFNSGYENDEYRLVFNPEEVSPEEEAEFVECMMKPSVSVYMVPAWCLKCSVEYSNPKMVNIFRKGDFDYPFDKGLIDEDSYKITFVNANDGPEIKPEYPPYEMGVNYYGLDINGEIYRLDYQGEYTREHINDTLIPDFFHLEGDAVNKYTSNLDDLKTMTEPESPQDLEHPISNAYGHSTYHVMKQNGAKVTLDIPLNKRYGKDAMYQACLFFSHAAKDFSEFIMRMSPEDSDLPFGIMRILPTKRNFDYMYYIDTTYTASFRNFDVRNGIRFWNELSGMVGGNLYSYGTNSIRTSTGKVVVSAGDCDELMTKWQVYKKTGFGTKELVLECYNRVLSLSLDEKGSYDIGLTRYSREGNISDTYLTNAVEVI